MTTYTPDLDEFLVPAATPSPWRRYGFLENPFPSRAHPIWGVMHNQTTVLRRFYTELAEFSREGNTTTMFFTGGNRVGKTHFCQHHRLALPNKLHARGQVLPIAVLSAQSCDFGELYRDLIDQIDDSIRAQTGAGLFEDEERLRLWPRLEEMLHPGDFKLALRALAQQARGQERDAIKVELRRWIRGERVMHAVRKRLGVASAVESLAHQLNALEGLVSYITVKDEVAPQVSLASRFASPGVLIFLDELELIWSHRRDRRDRFLQALRAFIDACPKGVFLCVAMATGLGPEVGDLELTYPALFARLTGVQDVPALVEIGGPPEAQEYTDAFIAFGREQARKERGLEGPFAELFSAPDIRRMFLEIAGRASGTASQGDFFDKLHVAAEQQVHGTH